MCQGNQIIKMHPSYWLPSLSSFFFDVDDFGPRVCGVFWRDSFTSVIDKEQKTPMTSCQKV
jgi:hypothetical protein